LAGITSRQEDRRLMMRGKRKIKKSGLRKKEDPWPVEPPLAPPGPGSGAHTEAEERGDPADRGPRQENVVAGRRVYRQAEPSKPRYRQARQGSFVLRFGGKR
jgi:hypothetical protein